MEHLGNSDVARVFAMSRQVSNEAHMYEEVIRFRELENGVLFSRDCTEVTGSHLHRGSFRGPVPRWKTG